MQEQILIIDDEANITRTFSALLKDEGYRPDAAAGAEEALALCDNRDYDLILLDLNLPGLSGIDFLKEINRRSVYTLVVVVSGQSEISTALEAVKLGALDYLEKPVQPDRLLTSVRSALLLVQARKQQLLQNEEVDRQTRIIGESPAVKRLLASIAQAAPTDVTVLITGENGTGKELVATRLFLQSKRRLEPFIKVNCPGIPATLFESELFGHKKGAFTGATRDFPGKFALADGGTLFLDEIGDLPLECQAKLLRVLETGEVEPLGGIRPFVADVRVVCATNRDLRQLMADKKFREDLFYRISVFTIEVPPLRERLADLPLLVGEFLKRFDPGQEVSLSSEAIAYLTTVDYPGNIRQLKNVIERITIGHGGSRITLDDMIREATAGLPQSRDEDQPRSMSEHLVSFEKELIRATLVECQGNIAKAARRLQVDRANLSRKIKEFGLKVP